MSGLGGKRTSLQPTSPLGKGDASPDESDELQLRHTAISIEQLLGAKSLTTMTMTVGDAVQDSESQEASAEIDKTAAAAIRRHIFPIFKDLGFQRLTKSVCERWDGAPGRPDRYLRLYLARRPPGAFPSTTYAVSVDLAVYHPQLEHRRCQTRCDSKGHYSPKIAEVARPRNDLSLWPDSRTPEWEAQPKQIEPMFVEMADRMRSMLVPAMKRFDDFGDEIAHFRTTALLTPHAVRTAVARTNEALAAGDDLGSEEAFHWCTRSRPVCFFSPDLRRPSRFDDWRDPDVSALINQSHSLHYMAALAARYASKESADKLRQLARAMEHDAGVSLKCESEAEFLGRLQA